MIQEPLYLGLDLSTQQLKAVVVISDLRAIEKVTSDFHADSTDLTLRKA